MAKHNLFLGSATNSVGDVTLMRRQGKQVSRARVREVANPKTYGQAFQRAAMANITKFYAPLAVPLERSWEGKNKAGSYSAFIKKNVELARTNNYLAMKGADFVPFPYYISMGTLSPMGTTIFSDSNAFFIPGAQPTENTLGAVSQRIISSNPSAKNGDQITLLAFVRNEDGFTPVWCRFYLDTTSAVAINTVLSGFTLTNIGQGGSDSYAFKPVNVADGLVAAAIILSRWENSKWRRSPEVLNVESEITSLFVDDDYIAECIASFQSSSNANPSDVYLNGQDPVEGTINTAIAGGSETNVLVGNIQKVFITDINALTPIAVDEGGTKYLFRNGVNSSTDYHKILTENGLLQTEDPVGYTIVEYQPDATAEGKAGAYQNYQYLRAQGFTNTQLGV